MTHFLRKIPRSPRLSQACSKLFSGTGRKEMTSRADNQLKTGKKSLFVLALLFSFLASFSNKAFAQTKITGTVKDTAGVTLVGVSVKLKNTSIGAVTDANGKFSLTTNGSARALIFSYIGYVPQEVPISGQNSINVTLKTQSSSLGEIVVIGYGTQRKKDVTGAVSSIKAADLDISTSSNFLQSMQGKAPGIQVTQSTGQPGASVDIKIRSNPSNADPGTLYVIDGVVVNNSPATPSAGKYGTTGLSQSPLNFINPNDIESIEILKDASSRAIYGAQAGAGVVLITTKHGKTGKPTVQYSGSYAPQRVDRMFQVLDTKDYMIQRNLIGQELYLQSNKIAPYYGTVDPSTVAAFTPLYTQNQINSTPQYPNAMDAITRVGYTQQHNISLSATTGKTSYYISGNYYDQKGVILGTDFRRWNGRVNLDQNISETVKAGINLTTSNSTSDNAVTGGQYQDGGIIAAALYYPANLPLQNPDGTYPLNPSYTSIPNPLSYSTVTDQLLNTRLLTSGYVSWEVIKGLTAKGNFSYDQSSSKRNSYFPTTFSYGAQVNGIASIANNSANTKQVDYTLNYKLPISQNQSLDLLAGYTYQLQNTDGVYAGNQNFITDAVSYYNLYTGQADKPGVGSFKTQATYASYFGRAIYQLNHKYTLQASLRRDGSSRFALNHKWGYFPAVSAGWNISDEKFMQNAKSINLLKLRVGYGEIGNANFPASAFEVYGTSVNPNFGTSSTSTAIYLTQAANPNLKWETAGEFNAGLDFALLGNRVTGSVDYFNKTIRDLITFIPFPADFTVSGVYGNAGTTKSTGYEIGIQTQNIVAAQKGGFTWSTNINFSHYLSYWSERSPQSLATLAKYIAPSGKDALFNGVYGAQATGQLFTGTYGSAPATMPGMLPGGIILKDIHGYDANGKLTGPDGKITAADQTLLGNTDPKFNIGFGNKFTYKNFDLNIFFSGAVQKAYSPYAGNGLYRIVQLQANLGTFGWNTMPISLQRWTFQNTKGAFPTGLADPTYSGYQNSSSYWFVDASYIRCQNITLGYLVPQSLLSRQKILSTVRLSFDLQNAFVITKYPALDPQISQNNFYPLSRSFVFGINATF
jgi:TonB-linked SusC/RagA family outer membrane protein